MPIGAVGVVSVDGRGSRTRSAGPAAAKLRAADDGGDPARAWPAIGKWSRLGPVERVFVGMLSPWERRVAQGPGSRQGDARRGDVLGRHRGSEIRTQSAG